MIETTDRKEQYCEVDPYLDEIMEETFGPIENVYIDLRYIQDFYLGAILALCKSKDEIQYVIDNIDYYNSRYTEDVVETVFSKLHLTEVEVQAYIHDPKNHSFLFKTSPVTDFCKMLKDINEDIEAQNTAASSNTKNVVSIYNINTYTLVLNNKDKIQLKEKLQWFTDRKNLLVASMSMPIENMSIDTYKEFKYMFAYDFYKIIQPTPLQTSGFTAFYEKRCLYNSFVYAPFRIVNDKVLEEVKYYDTDKLKELVLDTARYLSICSKFSYINPEIIVR